MACSYIPLVSFSRGGSARRFLKLGKRFIPWQPWFYARLVAYRYFWFSEGHSVQNNDSVSKHSETRWRRRSSGMRFERTHAVHEETFMVPTLFRELIEGSENAR